MHHFLSRVFCALLVFVVIGSTRTAAAVPSDRLINISSRTQVSTGDNVMIAGFVIGQGGPKRVLIRAVGPGLTQFGVSGVLADPFLELHTATQTIATNDNWNAADGAAITEAGAFPLGAGSKDSVIVTTLDPGLYTAVASGVNATTGVGLVEIYDLSGPSRLINISTRAQVGTGGSVMISGFIVGSGAAPRKILIRAAGPALSGFGVSGLLSDPTLTVFNGSGAVIATNDNWQTGDAAMVTAVTAAISQAAGFPFAAGSKDAAVVLDLPGGGYTVHVGGVNGATGVALLECFDITPGAATASAMLSATTTVPTTSVMTPLPAAVAISRTGDISTALTVNYTLSGTAQPADYTGPTGSVTIPAGANSATVTIAAKNTLTSGTRTVALNLVPPAGYTVGSGSAEVTLHYSPGTLYVANLRTTTTAASTAFGTSTIQLSPDERFAYVNLSFSGLSAPQTVAYLRLSQAGEDGAYLAKLPNGQLSSIEWTITASGIYTVQDIVAAIKAGKVYVDIATTTNPSGELRGSFLLNNTGTQAFVAPPAPPALPAGAPTPQQAARFLLQATFGPTKADIDALPAKGFATWITEQMALPPTLHKDATNADFTTFNTDVNKTRAETPNRQAAWWKTVLTSPDQLRQRVAFALSEIFVVSDANDTLPNWQEGLANYYDILVKGAFGNFRTVLEDVTLSPIMGIYLSSIRNSKATGSTQPDENYAREVMQLFTIGLNELQPDGTLKLDGAGLPLPTYNQATITNLAKVFTGWQFNNAAPTTGNFRSGGNMASDYLLPMTLNPNFHENAAKTIEFASGQKLILPANQGGLKDLKDTLDTLFNHPNVGPFISRQLIQRLVTSNPSPGYIYRVAQAFANNGNGVRGDLGAVVRAILTDYEARSPQVAGTLAYGKLKEPLLRLTGLLRAFNGAADNGRYNIFNAEGSLAQAPLRSPTVFNFFEPNYVVPGALASAGLYAPEYQILTDTTAISAPNMFYDFIYATRGATTIGLTLTGLPPTTPASGLVDYLNLVLCGGSMPTAIRDRIATALTSMPAATTDTEKYRSAIYLTLSTQSSAVQK